MGFGATISKHHGEHLLFNFFGDMISKTKKRQTPHTTQVLTSKHPIPYRKKHLFGKARQSKKRFCPDYFEEHYLEIESVGIKISTTKQIQN